MNLWNFFGFLAKATIAQNLERVESENDREGILCEMDRKSKKGAEFIPEGQFTMGGGGLNAPLSRALCVIDSSCEIRQCLQNDFRVFV